MTQATATDVRRQVTVEVPIEEAVTAFTERFGDVKPPEHNLLDIGPTWQLETNAQNTS